MTQRIKLTSELSVLPASAKLAAAGTIGLVGAAVVGIASSWKFAPLVGWDIAALAFMAATWPRLLSYRADVVKKHALREDPTRVITDIVLIGASLASLAAVGFVLLAADGGSGSGILGRAVVGFVSVVVSWLIIHTVYTLRYAELYYRQPEGGVEFPGTTAPTYSDFAYLAFTLGMTYQVSDTNLASRTFRATALRHALLSYLFGTIIIATTINLVAGLGK
jgi:uncharacterized membrane protein